MVNEVERDKMSQAYYAEQLIEYFKRMIIENPGFLSIVESNSIDSYSYLPIIGQIMNKIVRKDFSALIYRDLILEIFEKQQSGELDLFVIPSGFSLENEKDFEWLYEAILYHLNESIKSLLALASTSIIDSLNKQQASLYPKFITPIIYQIVEAQNPSMKEILNDILTQIGIERIEKEITKFLTETINPYEYESLINNYIQDFDLLLSFFFRPWGEENEFFKTADVLDNLSSKLGEKFRPIFTPLDVTLRNKLVHRNYFIDTKTKEIIYYVSHPNGRKNIKYKSIIDLKSAVFQLKLIRINFFFVALSSLFEKLGQLSPPFVHFYALWNPIDKNNLFRELFGFDLGVIATSPKENAIARSMIELRTIFNWQRGLLIRQPEEYNLEKIFTEFWRKIFESDDLRAHHELILAYFLFCIAHTNPEIYKIGLSLYIKISEEIKEEIRKKELLSEFRWIIMGTVPEEEIAQLSLAPSAEKLIKLLNRIKKTPYQKYIRESTINKVSTHLKEELKNLPAIRNLMNLLEQEQRTLTGCQIAGILRTTQNEEWPQPDFISAGECIRAAEKLGLVDIEVKGDFIVSLPKGD